MATSYDISGIQGEDLNLNIAVTDSNGNAFDLSGATLSGQVRYSYGSTGILLRLSPTINSGSTGELFASGLAPVNIDATGMAAMPVGKFVYDIERYSGVADGAKILRGSFIVEPEVTR